ncbi:MAG: hypothetical protein IID36_11265 [Planctomycetes bacterium]|nr:hypothetical protein [Planctomycetota bacterium]
MRVSIWTITALAGIGTLILVGARVGAQAIDSQDVAVTPVEAERTVVPTEDDGELNGGGGLIGPDVVVHKVAGGNDTHYYGTVGGIAAYSVATTSCNVGDLAADWFTGGSNLHPVIAQNMYRLKDGKFEQIGMSWLKHGFCAVNESGCGSCQHTPCSTLGVGCADTYWATLNGSFQYSGPRSEVNAASGWHPHPFTSPTGNSTIRGRLQVVATDLLNEGAEYFVEAHYVTQDDAEWGNGDNNASWVKLNFLSLNTVINDGPTHTQQPGLSAWRLEDPLVKIAAIKVTGDGTYHIGSRVYDNGDGTWDYEYALFNMNSDRSGQAFRVPIPEDATAWDPGFHDVFYHSGEPYSGEDWAAVITDSECSWSTQTYDENTNANALRWSTMYNFRFTSDGPPVSANAYLDLFKPGTPETVILKTTVPSLDCNDNNVADFLDILNGDSDDDNDNGIPDECESLSIVSSDPPNGAIDARQTSNPDGSAPDGWDSIDIAFSGDTADLTVADFTVTVSDGTAPVIVDLISDGDTVTLVFDSVIPVGAWTSIGHTASSTSTAMAYLPADVNGDCFSSANDVLTLIDALNGAIDPLEEWSSDIDRSGATNPADVLRTLDLLNGAQVYDEWAGVGLCPDGCPEFGCP